MDFLFHLFHTISVNSSCNLHMNIITFFTVIYFLSLITRQLEVNPTTFNAYFKTTKQFCIQDLHSSPQSAYFQDRIIKVMYRTQDGASLVTKNAFPMITYKKMECLGNRKISLLTPNNTIYLYDTIQEHITSFNGILVSDITYVKGSQISQKMVYISNFSLVHFKSIPFSSSEQTYELNGTFSNIVCSTYRNKSLDGFCFLLSKERTKIKFFNTQFPTKTEEKEMLGFRIVKISEMNERIFVGFESGEIKEYSLKEGLMFFERSTKISKDSPILDLVINELRNQLIYLNAQFKTGIISLASGFQIGSTLACQSYCKNESKIVIFSESQFAFFTSSPQSPTVRPFLNNQVIINSSSLYSENPLKALCLTDQLYFNKTLQKCVMCQPGCSLCDEQTAFCFSCVDGSFMKNNECFSCKYTALDEQKYKLCFQQGQINVITFSNSVTPVLVSGIQSTYSILSGSALLFLFIRFINFWSLVSMYYFLNIETIPYFLMQFLSKIFTILYGSVFEYFGIDISSVNMGIQERETNQKMKLTQISTDFLASNFESIITFIYSMVLICVLYDAIKNWFAKFKVHVFEKVKLEACLEEFMGIFIPLVVPLSYFLNNLTATNTLNQINNGLFILFLGIGAIFPFIYIILIVKRVTLKQRLDMIKIQIHQNLLTSQKLLAPPIQSLIEPNESRIQPQNQIKNQSIPSKNKPLRRQAFRIKQTASSNVSKFFQKSIDFVTQQEGQKFLYCLYAFWSPFLVGFSNPGFFLFFGTFISLIGICNAFYANHWRGNVICEKFILFAYHICFVIMALFPDVSFMVSLIAIALIICGGVHQLASTVAQKVYFIYLVLKNKRILRGNQIAQQELSKSQKNILTIFQFAQKFQNNDKKSQCESKVSIQGPTLKEIIDNKTAPNIGIHKIIKKTKFIEGNHHVLFQTNKKVSGSFYLDKLTSIQSISFQNNHNQTLNDHKKVIFQDFVDSEQIQNSKKSQSYNLEFNMQVNKKIQNFEEQKNEKQSSIIKFEEELFTQHPLPKLNKKNSSLKNKENCRTQNQFSTNSSENYVSKSVLNLKSKTIKQSRFLKIISTKFIQKKTEQIASVKTLEKQNQVNSKKSP